MSMDPTLTKKGEMKTSGAILQQHSVDTDAFECDCGLTDKNGTPISCLEAARCEEEEQAGQLDADQKKTKIDGPLD